MSAVHDKGGLERVRLSSVIMRVLVLALPDGGGEGRRDVLVEDKMEEEEGGGRGVDKVEAEIRQLSQAAV